MDSVPFAEAPLKVSLYFMIMRMRLMFGLVIVVLYMWVSLSSLSYSRSLMLSSGLTTLLMVYSLLFYGVTSTAGVLLGWSGMGFVTGLSMFVRCSSVGRVSMLWVMCVSVMSTYMLLVFVSRCSFDIDDLGLFLDVPYCVSSLIYLLVPVLMKSLCFPFSMWLIMAMRGSSYISGLVHSCTVVFGGYYLIALLRLYAVLSSSLFPLLSILMVSSLSLHSCLLLYSSSRKLVLGYGTCISVNASFSLLVWDPSYGLLYGIFQGFLKGYLFSVYGCSSSPIVLAVSMFSLSIPGSLLYRLEAPFSLGFTGHSWLLWLSTLYIYVCMSFTLSKSYDSVNRSVVMNEVSTFILGLGLLLMFVT